MALKVVGTGLGRTGTKSMQTALNTLGVGPCHHMVEVFAHPESMQLWIDAAEGRLELRLRHPETFLPRGEPLADRPEALERLVECYVALGISNEAKATAAVLGYNFPGSDWYQDAYRLLVKNNMTPEKDDSTWIGNAWHSVF